MPNSMDPFWGPVFIRGDMRAIGHCIDECIEGVAETCQDHPENFSHKVETHQLYQRLAPELCFKLCIADSLSYLTPKELSDRIFDDKLSLETQCETLRHPKIRKEPQLHFEILPGINETTDSPTLPWVGLGIGIGVGAITGILFSPPVGVTVGTAVRSAIIGIATFLGWNALSTS